MKRECKLFDNPCKDILVLGLRNNGIRPENSVGMVLILRYRDDSIGVWERYDYDGPWREWSSNHYLTFDEMERWLVSENGKMTILAAYDKDGCRIT